MLPRLMVNRHFTGRVTVRPGSLFQPLRGGDAKPPCQTLDVLDAVLTKRRGSLPVGSGGVARSIPGSPALPAQGAQRLAQEGSFIVVQAVHWIWLVHAVVLRSLDRTVKPITVRASSSPRKIRPRSRPDQGPARDGVASVSFPLHSPRPQPGRRKRPGRCDPCERSSGRTTRSAIGRVDPRIASHPMWIIQATAGSFLVRIPSRRDRRSEGQNLDGHGS